MFPEQRYGSVHLHCMRHPIHAEQCRAAAMRNLRRRAAVRSTLWIKHSDEETRDQQFSATAQGLVGIGPRDELEGMIAAQLLAAHNAAMECYRRAMFTY